SNPYFTYRLDYMTFSALPVFLMAFLRERFTGRRRSVVSVLIYLGAASYVLEMLLHFSGIADMREFLPILHGTFALDALLFFALLITMKRSSKKKLLILQIIPIICGMIFDVTNYYMHWLPSVNDLTSTTFGVLIFMLFEFYHLWRGSVDIYVESMESQFYRKMAYVDALTGIGNRMAYEMESADIRSGRKKVETVTVVSVDVNDLKIANDTNGHSAGDFLLKNTAELLSAFADGFGQAFRYGGDEFCVFLYDVSSVELQRRIAEMNRQIADINSRSQIKLRLALGYVSGRPEELQASVSLADKKMYEDKNREKAMAD
ncbi:MAG: GGDEF domain-containing protein, partial [Candidatus Limivicinus sp.]